MIFLGHRRLTGPQRCRPTVIDWPAPATLPNGAARRITKNRTVGDGRMLTSCVSVRGKRVFALVGLAGLAASIMVSLSSPAEARRRHHKHRPQHHARSGGYNPPF